MGLVLSSHLRPRDPSKVKRVVLLALLVALTACTTPAKDAPVVTLIADGETRTFATEALTVRDLLNEAEITLDPDDRVTPVEPTLIENGLTVRVVRVEVRTETEQREIPYERQVGRDASIPAGETRLLQAGITGIEELTYRITLEDGVEVDRQLARQVTLQEPRPEIVMIGTQADLSPVPITGTVAYLVNRNAWVIQTTSPNQRRLTYTSDLDGRVFTLSPDGNYLLFTRVTTETGGSAPLNTLWMVETVAADAVPVQVDVEGVLWADWAPDCVGEPDGYGCRIAYTTGVWSEGSPGWKAANDLWIAWPRARDGQLVDRRLVVEPSAGGTYGWWGTTYAWAPDGQRLAYAHAEEVGVVDLSDGSQTVLVAFVPYRTFSPWAWTPTVSWSPEGAFIVATVHGPSPTGESAEDSPVFDVWVFAADGLIAAELANEAGMWAAPVYASEGEGILFFRARSPYSSRSSRYDLYLMDRDGSDHRRLFPPEGEIGLEYRPQTVAWGPGGDRLLVVYQGNVYLLRLGDGDLHQLTTGGGVTAVTWQW